MTLYDYVIVADIQQLKIYSVNLTWMLFVLLILNSQLVSYSIVHGVSLIWCEVL